jgi:hypothetical protein
VIVDDRRALRLNEVLHAERSGDCVDLLTQRRGRRRGQTLDGKARIALPYHVDHDHRDRPVSAEAGREPTRSEQVVLGVPLLAVILAVEEHDVDPDRRFPGAEEPRDLKQHRHPARPVVGADNRLRAVRGVALPVRPGPRVVMGAEENSFPGALTVLGDDVHEMERIAPREDRLERLQRYVRAEQSELLDEVPLHRGVLRRPRIPRPDVALLPQEHERRIAVERRRFALRARGEMGGGEKARPEQ